MSIKDKVEAALYEVIDPELNINIMDLGLVYDISVESKNVSIRMTLTTPGCPLHATIVTGVKTAIEKVNEVENVEVDLVWTPAWSPANMSDYARVQLMHR
ncbi:MULTISPECIES: metal-sulfur cluster assembly factor [Gracilibacillus]|uniref:DUF59 domain-containing protein n=1 Tax=Gracilibacillus dipsosauri TaxID=178340 RepID=A0A317KVT4_9BACI|nr:iron-sulfur cluster assembly protein [Gracilibacillus dipsosauri]PWU67612.1 DUF59 domain-containing protein [Gracilibacillus dipsosauri]